MSDVELDTPVALVIFNRPAHTKRVFDAIAAVRPKRLFIIADGPRSIHPTDVERCRSAREIVDSVAWPCDVRTDFADANMGSRDRTVSGANWVFDQVEEAIFLEDDTVPDASFFRFCEELLHRFRNDRRVMTISGVCLDPSWPSKYSYGFSVLHCPWGRALWRRSWELFDVGMTLWPDVRDGGLLSDIFSDRAQSAYWHRIMEATYRGRFDAWDYPFIFSGWLQSGLSIAPERNLVRNIGFGPDSTHTRVDGVLGDLPLQSIAFPLRHPPMVMRDYGYDRHVNKLLLRTSALPVRIRNKVKRLIEGSRLGRANGQGMPGMSSG